MKHILRHIVSAITVLAFLTACNNTNEGSDGGNVLVRLGDSRLTAAEVSAAIPAGTETADSLRMAQRYIDQWIDTHLITDVIAPTIPDIDEINRLTEQYRLSLIEDAYRTRMYRKNSDDNIPEDSLRACYDRFKDNLRLKSPIVKGVYLKFPEDSKALKEARKLIKSSAKADVDKLEKIAYDNAVNYDYFRDRWIDWQKMMALIPSDFGSDPMSYPAHNRNLDITADGFTYLLNITDCKGVGEQIPYEYAREQIRDIILYEHRKEYDRSLRNQLKEDAINNGKLVIYN